MEKIIMKTITLFKDPISLGLISTKFKLKFKPWAGNLIYVHGPQADANQNFELFFGSIEFYTCKRAYFNECDLVCRFLQILSKANPHHIPLSFSKLSQNTKYITP